MADYYTKVSFAFTAHPNDTPNIMAAYDDLREIFSEDELDAFHIEPLGCNMGIDLVAIGDEISIYGDEHVDIEALAVFLLRAAPKSLPIEFVWTYDCSKPRTDAYGGGACRVTVNGYDTLNTNDLLRMLQERLP